MLVGACAPAPERVSLAFSYWGDDRATNQLGYVASYSHHACSGDVAIFSSTHIPRFEEVPGITPDKIVEFSEFEEILGKRAVPLESNIVAVINDTVVFGYAPDLAIAVDQQGNFDVISMVYQAFHPIECPVFLSAEFPGSAYMRCRSFVEGEKSKTRLIAYEDPCT